MERKSHVCTLSIDISPTSTKMNELVGVIGIKKTVIIARIL